MYSVVGFTLVVVVFIFLYMRHSARRRKKHTEQINSVRDYHASYDRVKTRKELRDRHSGYQSYVTKYNSTEDYRESGKTE